MIRLDCVCAGLTCRLCDTVDVDVEDDVSNLFASLAGNFENVVQYNQDNREFEVLSTRQM